MKEIGKLIKELKTKREIKKISGQTKKKCKLAQILN